jgi:acyl-CoA thioester hydrolase
VSGLQSTSHVRVRYAETDTMGIVYYANYLVWFEVARADLLREAGWSYREMEADGYMLPVLEANCVYRQPARYDDEINVKTTGTLMSPVRVKFMYDVVRSTDDVRLATGYTIHAAIGRGGRPCRLPDRVCQLLA